MRVVKGVAAVCVRVVVEVPVATAEQALDNREGDQVLAEAGVCKTSSRLTGAETAIVVTVK